MLRSVHSLDLPLRVHATEETLMVLYGGRRRAGCDAAADRLCRPKRGSPEGGFGAGRYPVLMAVSALLRHSLDVSRSLRERRYTNASRGGTGRPVDRETDGDFYSRAYRRKHGALVVKYVGLVVCLLVNLAITCRESAFLHLVCHKINSRSFRFFFPQSDSRLRGRNPGFSLVPIAD